MSRKRTGLRKALVVVGVLALVVPLLLAWAGPVSAATITVCASGCDYTSIQDAVDNAGAGDVINVYPGTYNESVDLSGHSGALTLRTVNNAGNPTAGTATVDGGTAGSAFYMSTTHGGNITVDGFVVESTNNDGMNLEANSNIMVLNVTASDSGEDGMDLEADGDVTVRDSTASNNDSNGIYVDDGDNVTITGCIANGNDDENFYIDEVDGDVTISGCTANRSEGDEGIYVDEVGGNVTITDSTANNNEDEGIDVNDVGMVAGEQSAPGAGDLEDVEPEDDDDQPANLGHSVNPSANGGDVTIKNCTTNANGEAAEDDDGIEISWVEGKVTISSCIARDNLDDGIDLSELEEADSILVDGNIICGNISDGLELDIEGGEGATVRATSADATGNWWGCAGGPGAAGCDTVNEIDGSVDFTPWIQSITSGASVDPATVGQPTVVSFQFSGGPPTVYLGQGPGDLHGAPTFIVTTDNGTVVSSGFIGASEGRLEVTLTPAHAGTATVWVDGPCGLDQSIVLGVVAAAEFVPEPGTVLLLGSGLLGLAGYAGLRLRKR